MLLPKHQVGLGVGLTWAELHDLAASQAGSNPSISSRLFSWASLIANSEYEKVHSESGIAINSMNSNEDIDWAIEALKTKCTHDHDKYRAWLNLGTAYLKKPDLDKAAECLIMAHKLEPNCPDVWIMLATLADMHGEQDNNLKALEAAAAGCDRYKMNLAMAKAKSGKVDWVDFFLLYSTRSEHPVPVDIEVMYSLVSPATWLRPDTENTFYVVYEQGIGDLVMMAPMLTWLSRRVKRVVFCSSNSDLNDLASLIPGVADVSLIPFNINKQRDKVINLMDLMMYFDQRWDIISSQRSFKVDTAHMSMSPEVSRPHDIGLNFQGNKRFWFEYARGIYDEKAINRIRDNFKGRYVDFTNGSGRLVDLAQRVAGLKLVVTTDTMIAHLAGALHVPCIVMLSVNRDWRWYHDLYPNTKTIVQDHLMEWNVVADKAIEMAKEMLCES